MTAVNAVFDTYELLENILLHLPWHDLFVVQRTCRSWKDMIAVNSIRARRATFVQAIAVSPEAVMDVSWTPDYHEGEDADCDAPMLNPFLRTFLHVQNVPQYLVHDGLVNPEVPETDGDAYAEERKHRALHYHDASWRSLQLFQPPVYAMTFPCFERGGPITHILIKNEDGVKVDDLAKEYMLHWRVCPHCPWWGLDEKGMVQKKWVLSQIGKVHIGTKATTGWDILATMREHPVMEAVESEEGYQSDSVENTVE